MGWEEQFSPRKKGRKHMTAEKKQPKKYIGNFIKYRYLLMELVRKNIKLQYRNSVLGIIWTLLQPLMTMAVISVVFSGIFGRDSSAVVNYSVYLLIGRLLFDFFQQATKKGMRSIWINSSIIKKVYVPRYIYPLSNVISTFVTFLISLIDLVVVIAFFNIIDKDPVTLTWRVIGFIVPIFILMLISMGVSMILSALDVFFRDIEYLYDVFCLLLFYVTPIFYTLDKLGIESNLLMTILKLNPLYCVIEMARAFLLFGNDFAAHWDWNLLWYALAFAVFFNIVGFALFYKKQDQFILHI